MEDFFAILVLAGVLSFLICVLISSRLKAEDQRTYTDVGPEKKIVLSDPDIRAHIPNLPKASVRWVIDGDTVIVRRGWSEITIRLDCIDCPEDGQPWGDIAKYGLIKLIGRQNIHLEEYGLDRYGRTLATIFVWNNQKNEWLNVNERMVTLGHAWVMRRFYGHLPQDRQNKLNRLEDWARSKRIGLWATENPVPPWEWRVGRDRDQAGL